MSLTEDEIVRIMRESGALDVLDINEEDVRAGHRRVNEVLPSMQLAYELGRKGEIELRQKLTVLALAAPKLRASAFPGPAVPVDQPVSLGRLVMLIHQVLAGEYDPRGLTTGLHTVEPGHVGSDGVMVPIKGES